MSAHRRPIIPTVSISGQSMWKAGRSKSFATGARIFWNRANDHDFATRKFWILTAAAGALERAQVADANHRGSIVASRSGGGLSPGLPPHAGAELPVPSDV